MEDKRRAKRTPMESSVCLHLISGDIERYVDADIVNVSKNGIGFTAEEQLLIGECYEAKITLWNSDKINAYLRIVRADMVEGQAGYSYGAVFVGMQDNELMRILIYQMFQEKDELD